MSISPSFAALNQIQWTPDEENCLIRELLERVHNVDLADMVTMAGVVSEVTTLLSSGSSSKFSPVNVVLKIYEYNQNFREFNYFKNIPGIQYDPLSNSVTTGYKYWAKTHTEPDLHRRFRTVGEAHYNQFTWIFTIGGFDLLNYNSLLEFVTSTDFMIEERFATMSSLREIPPSDMLWDTGLDKLLLDLFIKKVKRIDLDRTIIATGIIVLVVEEFNYQSGSRYSVGEILRRINDLKERYKAFKVFKSIDGVSFHIPTLRFNIGHAYYMVVGLVSENPQHTRFRLLGEPLYEELTGIFTGRGIGSIDLKWVYAYYTGDVTAIMEMSHSA